MVQVGQLKLNDSTEKSGTSHIQKIGILNKYILFVTIEADLDHKKI